MSLVKSFSFPEGDIRGDMFYIKHDSDNFTVIDCFLKEGEGRSCRQDEIIDEIRRQSGSRIRRFISTHPDKDHILGIEKLDASWHLTNFYAVDNQIPVEAHNPSLSKYKELLDTRNCQISRGLERCWLNRDDVYHNGSNINFLWPILTNEKFQETLEQVKKGESPNNISCVTTYRSPGGITYMWLGDMETDMQKEFYEQCKHDIPQVDILFHPHHGRESGKIPNELLEKLNPQLIIISNAPCQYLDYGDSDKTITQNTSGDILFINEGNMVHVYTENRISNKPRGLNLQCANKIEYLPNGWHKDWYYCCSIIVR